MLTAFFWPKTAAPQLKLVAEMTENGSGSGSMLIGVWMVSMARSRALKPLKT
jgi:hypothetical protein